MTGKASLMVPGSVRAAARLLVEMDQAEGKTPDPRVIALANAKASPHEPPAEAALPVASATERDNVHAEPSPHSS
jgi:hypothetical protein